jgi:hypothetical protein
MAGRCDDGDGDVGRVQERWREQQRDNGSENEFAERGQ